MEIESVGELLGFEGNETVWAVTELDAPKGTPKVTRLFFFLWHYQNLLAFNGNQKVNLAIDQHNRMCAILHLLIAKSLMGKKVSADTQCIEDCLSGNAAAPL